MAGILDLLNSDLGKTNGGILDNLGGLFNGGVDNGVKQDGSKILGHILGNKQAGVEQVLGQKAGMDSGAVGDILKVAAPILMGVLGKQASQSNVSSASGISKRFLKKC